MQRMRGTRGMFTTIPGNLLEDSRKCYFFNIPGNVQEDSEECSRRFRGMFRKIPGNAFNFKLIKATFFLWTSFAISNETTERSNTMIWYFHFFEIQIETKSLRPWEKAKKKRLKAKTNRRRKWIKEIKVIFVHLIESSFRKSMEIVL